MDNERKIHWSKTPAGICERKDSGADVITQKQCLTTITNSAEADHLGNVTCLECRKFDFKNAHYLVFIDGDGPVSTVVKGLCQVKEIIKETFCGDVSDDHWFSKFLESIEDTDSWSTCYPDYACMKWSEHFEDCSIEVIRITNFAV